MSPRKSRGPSASRGGQRSHQRQDVARSHACRGSLRSQASPSENRNAAPSRRRTRRQRTREATTQTVYRPKATRGTEPAGDSGTAPASPTRLCTVAPRRARRESRPCLEPAHQQQYREAKNSRNDRERIVRELPRFQKLQLEPRKQAEARRAIHRGIVHDIAVKPRDYRADR